MAYEKLFVGREVVRQHLEVELEQLRHGLMPGKARQQEIVLAERGLDRDQPFILCEGVQRHGFYRRCVIPLQAVQ